MMKQEYFNLYNALQTGNKDVIQENLQDIKDVNIRLSTIIETQNYIAAMIIISNMNN